MDDITLEPITWSAPEYTHKERTVDFFWTVGLVTLVASGIALWFHSYLFAVFILISGASLILFALRPPQIIEFAIETKGFTIGNELHAWNTVRGFTIKKDEPYAKLLIETSRYFLPIFTIPLPQELVPEVKDTLLLVIPAIELEESRSMQFMEKMGF